MSNQDWYIFFWLLGMNRSVKKRKFTLRRDRSNQREQVKGHFHSWEFKVQTRILSNDLFRLLVR
jgi:hypothetical protein